MAISQKNSYVVGSNADLSNALLNIDLNRIGGDLTYLENDGGTLKVSVGSLIESQGSIYAVSGAAETPSGTAQDGSYLFFDDSVPEFVWSTTAGTYDPTRGGIYDGNNRRQCRFRLSSTTTFDILISPSVENAAFEGTVAVDGSFFPTSSPVEDTIFLSDQAPWVPSRGLYILTVSDNLSYLEVYVNGTWQRSVEPFISGTIVADGANVRIWNTNPSLGSVIYLLKF
jgi:hypothetical protein